MKPIYIQEDILTQMLNKSQDPEANVDGGPIEIQGRWWALLKLDPDGQVRRLWILPETPMVAKAYKAPRMGVR
jgi:hypothetical protein